MTRERKKKTLKKNKLSGTLAKSNDLEQLMSVILPLYGCEDTLRLVRLLKARARVHLQQQGLSGGVCYKQINKHIYILTYTLA